MKILKYVGAAIFLLLGLSQIIPIFGITAGLLQGQGGDDSTYFIGKLVGHIFVTVLVLLLASKLFKSAREKGESSDVSV